MEKILIAHWVPSDFIQEKLGLKHNTEIPFTKEKRNEIIDEVLESGYEIMLVNDRMRNRLIIWIDNRYFRQR